ncbi:hypothetical protein GJU43_10725 [Flavobacterium sp. LC2016-23]|uniref:hypothetical protein n=1 Tax=Flavobacterium sp. LC2016-23 TaxID=2666330 RepID=UPI0012B04C4D|nr:hypothetical protein [Flavobacterium sp. LC2016-23]MRX39749.1 hypothetical protein [Flavobacterium sp. LC2016-23]
MKKIAIISLLVNILLLISIVVLYSKCYNIKSNLKIQQKNKITINSSKKIDSIIDKSDPIYIYNTHKFPRDSGYTSYDYNMNTGERLQFADSLLNELLKSKLNMLNKYIKIDKEMVLKVKDNTFFVKALKINIGQKNNLAKSQKLWEQMRKLNYDNVWLGCSGATACTGIANDADIKFVLERMEKIKKIEAYN